MDLLLAGALALNFVFGVAIVICNKAVVALDGFNFIVVLTLCHFLFTLLACIIMAKGRVFVPKHLPWTKRLCLSSASLGSIVFMNLNLAHNSVGFYQLSKLMCIPVIIVAEYWGYGKFPSSATIAAVAAIAMGVAAVGATDVSVDPAGLALAAVAVLTTSIGQILCSHYQKELECDPMQLLYSTCPIVTLGLIGMVPVFHDTEALMSAPLSPQLVTHIILSCICALGINVTNYMVLGKTSALTYQVLGHFKTVLILFIGTIVFQTPYNTRLLAGTIMALAGVVGYTEVKRRGGLRIKQADGVATHKGASECGK